MSRDRLRRRARARVRAVLIVMAMVCVTVAPAPAHAAGAGSVSGAIGYTPALDVSFATRDVGFDFDVRGVDSGGGPLTLACSLDGFSMGSLAQDESAMVGICQNAIGVGGFPGAYWCAAVVIRLGLAGVMDMRCETPGLRLNLSAALAMAPLTAPAVATFAVAGAGATA